MRHGRQNIACRVAPHSVAVVRMQVWAPQLLPARPHQWQKGQVKLMPGPVTATSTSSGCGSGGASSRIKASPAV